MKINCEQGYLWRAVDQEGEVLEIYVTNGRDREEALKFMKNVRKWCGREEVAVTDKPNSFSGAMIVICNVDMLGIWRWKK